MHPRAMTKGDETEQLQGPSGASVVAFEVRVVAGKDVGRGASSQAGRLTVGVAEGNNLRLSDPKVSRYHLEFEAHADGVVVRDLGSTNGTTYRRALVREILVHDGCEFELGRATRLQLTISKDRELRSVSQHEKFYGMVGRSAVMREVFLLLERAAKSDAPVLILGEAGTGKELAASAIHMASKRAQGPFEVVNCASIPPGTAHSELFGHKAFSFTDAKHDHKGVFELAHGGTLFLDEIGELPLDMQPLLLRALEAHTVRRMGEEQDRKVDVRIVAATNRDLRKEVNAGRFRDDLFYRLSMVQVRLPALRERLDDLQLLVPHLIECICKEFSIEREVPISDAFFAEMVAHSWPGNVRELRNHLGSFAVLREAPDLSTERPSQHPYAGPVQTEDLFALPLKAARDRLLERFDRRYILKLLDDIDTVKDAAVRAGVDRVTLHRMITRLGLRDRE